MKKINGIIGMDITYQKIGKLIRISENKKILVGIAGPVATGKSKFTQELYKKIQTVNFGRVVNIPFDFWINPNGLKNETYKEKFFLDDFAAAICSIKKENYFLVPRYDLYTHESLMVEPTKPTTQSVFWQGRYFNKIEAENQTKIEGSTDTYLETINNYPYSLFDNNGKIIYLIDGTLIAPKQIQTNYDLLIFIDAPWINRIANMIRRFNRNEVFGKANYSLDYYIEFLVNEAKSCADKEIFEQLNDNFIVIEYSPMNLSNYLDLWYLKQLIISAPYITSWVTKDNIDHAIDGFINKLKTEYNPKILKDLRVELENLSLAKHLLCIQNINDILQELRKILK